MPATLQSSILGPWVCVCRCETWKRTFSRFLGSFAYARVTHDNRVPSGVIPALILPSELCADAVHHAVPEIRQLEQQ